MIGINGVIMNYSYFELLITDRQMDICDSRVAFATEKSLFLAFFVKSSIICVGNVRESNEGCQIEVLKVWKSDYNC